MVKIRYKDGTSEEIKGADGVKRGIKEDCLFAILNGDKVLAYVNLDMVKSIRVKKE